MQIEGTLPRRCVMAFASLCTYGWLPSPRPLICCISPSILALCPSSQLGVRDTWTPAAKPTEPACTRGTCTATPGDLSLRVPPREKTAQPGTSRLLVTFGSPRSGWAYTGGAWEGPRYPVGCLFWGCEMRVSDGIESPWSQGLREPRAEGAFG